MFEQAIQASDAMQKAARQGTEALIPALCGCPRCHTVRMITSPALGTCNNCATELTVLGSARPQGADNRNPLTRAA